MQLKYQQKSGYCNDIIELVKSQTRMDSILWKAGWFKYQNHACKSLLVRSKKGSINWNPHMPKGEHLQKAGPGASPTLPQSTLQYVNSLRKHF